MRVPTFARFVHWLQGFALILCGMVMGAAIFMSITHQQLDDQIKKNREFQDQIKKLKDDHASSELNNKPTVIKSIEVDVDNKLGPEDKDLDPVIKSELERRVEADIAGLKGQSISSIEENPQYIQRIYGKRHVPNIHGKDYEVEIHTLIVVYGKLKIWVYAKEYVQKPS